MIGMPNELYWDSTREEVDAVFRQRADYDAAQNKAANLRAGLVAATLINIYRKPGARTVKPSDFVVQERQYMSPKEGRTFMDRWAATENADRTVRGKSK
ncbi:unnamed protein product [marine sediment metagenome]|uniref:Uncharacterized protein n=1 Tax=marine sediment metagenome TaxID=412755 RepID=X0RGM9_9ZZZZ